MKSHLVLDILHDNDSTMSDMNVFSKNTSNTLVTHLVLPTYQTQYNK
ncbi:hypothetical protein O6H91_08G020700 [Diphasiastrum complanatum]|uniref:Uncharacterized protein n=1 Tax=Diphasiastrum complanatum TaxID=34168 RepID=A0ACC2CVL2_DIPCM|nr:hypothetical protein O6H91_08G020700 [Diphasiastrum complanatum]